MRLKSGANSWPIWGANFSVIFASTSGAAFFEMGAPVYVSVTIGLFFGLLSFLFIFKRDPNKTMLRVGQSLIAIGSLLIFGGFGAEISGLNDLNSIYGSFQPAQGSSLSIFAGVIVIFLGVYCVRDHPRWEASIMATDARTNEAIKQNQTMQSMTKPPLNSSDAIKPTQSTLAKSATINSNTEKVMNELLERSQRQGGILRAKELRAIIDRQIGHNETDSMIYGLEKLGFITNSSTNDEYRIGQDGRLFLANQLN